MARLGHVAVVVAIELEQPHVGMAHDPHHAPEIGVLLITAEHLQFAVAREDEHRRRIGPHVVHRRHVIDQRLRVGQPQLAAARKVRHRLAAVGDQGHEGRIGIDSVGGKPPLVEADHRGQVAAGRVPGNKDPLRIAPVRGDVFDNPRGGRSSIRHTVGHLHLRHKAVLHADDRHAVSLQRLGDLAATARQASAVKPDDCRKALRIGREIDIQAAH